MNAYNGDFRNVNDKTVKIHREQIFPLKSKFVFYFGESYRKPIDDLLRLLYNIVSSDGTSMNKEQFKSYVKERVDKIESVKNR